MGKRHEKMKIPVRFLVGTGNPDGQCQEHQHVPGPLWTFFFPLSEREGSNT